MNKSTIPQFTLETGQRPALNALEQHLLTVAARWCENASSIGSINEFKKKLESEAAWFCHEHHKSPTSIEIGSYDETMLYIKPAGRNIRATATIRLTEPENDLGYELQAAHSAGYYTPRFFIEAMPIDYKKYHPKWTLIGRLIRRRAANKCEKCGVENGAVGYWIKGRFWAIHEIEEVLDKTGEDLCENIPIEKKPWPIVLTVAHLDHDIANNRFNNLAALCQVCHLTHDRWDNAQRLKYGRKGRFYRQIKLFIS